MLYHIKNSKGESLTKGFFAPEFETCPMAFLRSDINPDGQLLINIVSRALAQKVHERSPVSGRLLDLLRLLDFEVNHRVNQLQRARMESYTAGK